MMSTYSQVLQLISPYFGNSNAADNFLSRQCKYHLNREPAELGPHDLWELAKWAMVSGGLLIGKDKAEELSDKIRDFRKSMGELPLGDRLAVRPR
jgi:hypothetical protein